MPIAGLSDVRRFSRGGKIRLGEKRTSDKSGKEYPAKLDYFLFDPTDPALVPVFAKLYGEKPKSLMVCFPSEDLEITFPQYYKCYTKSGLLCKGDGDTATRFQADEDQTVPCPGPSECPFAMQHGVSGKPGCKRLASLRFFLPDLPVIQVFQIDTTSKISITRVNSGLDILRTVAGRISFVPVKLTLEEVEVILEDGKKSTVYALNIVIPVSLRQAQNALRPLIGAAAAAPLALPPAEEKAPEDLYPRSQITPEPVQTPGTQPEPPINGSTAREQAFKDIGDTYRELGVDRKDAAAFITEKFGDAKGLDLQILLTIPDALRAQFGTPVREPGDEPQDDLFGAPNAEPAAAPATDGADW